MLKNTHKAKHLTNAIISSILISAATASVNLGPIWFIGDSITQSNADGDGNGSPRESLRQLLTANNYSFSYTGHSTSNVDGLPTTGNSPTTNLYHYHSGVSASLIGTGTSGRTNMTANIPNWWNSGRLAFAEPSIALIMLGTNDTDINDDVANAPDRMGTLINTILSQPGGSDTSFFVAQIPPNLANATENNRVINFNNGLATLVSDLQNTGLDINLVDMYTPINADSGNLMRDTLHTNAAGNDVLAQQWFNAIEDRFAPVPEPTTAFLISFASLAAFIRRRN